MEIIQAEIQEESVLDDLYDRLQKDSAGLVYYLLQSYIRSIVHNFFILREKGSNADSGFLDVKSGGGC